MARIKFLIIGFAIVAIFLIASVLAARQLSQSKFQPFFHSADYSQLIGQLIYSDLEGGFWMIRYGEATNKFGGKFVLGNDRRLANFKNGDLVKITGHISKEQVSFYQAGTLYTIETIGLLK